MEQATVTSHNAEQDPGKPPNNRRRRNRPKPESTTGPSSSGTANEPRPKRNTAKPRADRERNSTHGPSGSKASTSSTNEPSSSRENRNRAKPHEDPGHRRVKFNSGLTPETSSGSKPSSSRPKTKKASSAPQDEDLTSSLIRGLSTAPYMECIICFSAIHPAQPTWACSPSIPVLPNPSSTSSSPQYCWSVFHLKCIRPWAEKTFKEVHDAWRARGDLTKGGEWRCPGCQGRRATLIGGYWLVNYLSQ